MTPNSAYSMEDIVVGTDYTPVDTTENVGGVNVINGKQPPIYALLCTASNSGPAEVQLLGMPAAITIPASTFKQGVVYYLYLKKLVADGGGTFVGFRYANHPLVY